MYLICQRTNLANIMCIQRHSSRFIVTMLCVVPYRNIQFTVVLVAMPILLAENLLTFNLSLNWVSIPILQTNVSKLRFPAFLKPLSLSLIRR